MLKNKYTSPTIEVEDLTKADVLCTSKETPDTSPDNYFSSYEALGEFWDLSGLM